MYNKGKQFENQIKKIKNSFHIWGGGGGPYIEPRFWLFGGGGGEGGGWVVHK